MLVLLGDIDPANFKPDLRMANELMGRMDDAAAGRGTGFNFEAPDQRTQSMRRERTLCLMFVDIAVFMLTQELEYNKTFAPLERGPNKPIEKQKFEMSHLIYLRKIIAVPPPQLIVFAWAMCFRNRMFAHDHAVTLALAKQYRVRAATFQRRVYSQTFEISGSAPAALRGTRSLMSHRRVARGEGSVRRSQPIAPEELCSDIEDTLPIIGDLDLLYGDRDDVDPKKANATTTCYGAGGYVNAHQAAYPEENGRAYDAGNFNKCHDRDNLWTSQTTFAGDSNNSPQFLPIDESGSPVDPGSSQLETSLDNRWLCAKELSGELKTVADVLRMKHKSVEHQMAPEVVADTLNNLLHRTVYVRPLVSKSAPRMTTSTLAFDAIRDNQVRQDIQIERPQLRREPGVTEMDHLEIEKDVRAMLSNNDNTEALRILGNGRFPPRHVNLHEPDEKVAMAKQVNFGEKHLKVLALSTDAAVACVELEFEAKAGLALESGFTGRKHGDEIPLHEIPSGGKEMDSFYDALIYASMVVARQCVWSNKAKDNATAEQFILPFISPFTNSFVTFKIGETASVMQTRKRKVESTDFYNSGLGENVDPFRQFALTVMKQRGLAEDCSIECHTAVLDLMTESGTGSRLIARSAEELPDVKAKRNAKAKEPEDVYMDPVD